MTAQAGTKTYPPQVGVGPATDTHQPLPVAGYKSQDKASIEKVNTNKMLEESILRVLDQLGQDPDVDKRWLAIGRSDIEKGWMAVNRSIFKPVRLDGK